MLESLAYNEQTKPIHSSNHTEGEEYSAYVKLNAGIKMEEKRLINKVNSVNRRFTYTYS